jgi:hypothetical protein
MTAKFVRLFSLFLLSFLSIFTHTVAAQPSNNTVKHEKFSFDYPADWRLVDKSSPGTQQYNLMPPSGNVLIMVISYDAVIKEDRFREVRITTAQNLADKLFAKLNADGRGIREKNCTVVENISFPGLRLTGFYDTQPSTAEIYYLALNQKFFNFIYLRDDKESAKADPAWNLLLSSFSFKDFDKKKPDFIIDQDSELVLNGRAKKLVRPLYPRDVTQFGAPDVKVRVTIDETGKVIAARAIMPYGNRGGVAAYAENAAKDSKFEPSLVCGKPSKITGIIVYQGFERRN